MSNEIDTEFEKRRSYARKHLMFCEECLGYARRQYRVMNNPETRKRLIEEIARYEIAAARHDVLRRPAR